MINSDRASNAHPQALLLEVINTLHQLGWRASVVHAYREVNWFADFLGKQGHSATFEWVVVDSISLSLGILLADDAHGCCLPRLVP